MTNFKPGDRVRKKNGDTFKGGHLVVTLDYLSGFGNWYFVETGTNLGPENLELAPTPRPHAELIKQWADDDKVVVELRSNPDKNWCPVANPSWFADMEYRIKPPEPEESEVDIRIRNLEEELDKLKKAREVER